MTDPDTLTAIKQRLLLGADAARRIATTDEPFLLHDEETYRAVATSLARMPDDIRLVLAELDILRGMFSERLASFFQQAVNGVNANGDGGADVGAVQDAPDTDSSPDERPNDEGTDSGVPAARPVRKRKSRSKPRRDTAGVQSDTGDVGRADGA